MRLAIGTLGLLGAWFRRKKVDSAAAVGLCCAHNWPVRCLLGFLFRKAEALDRWGEKTKHIWFLTSSATFLPKIIVIGSCMSSCVWKALRPFSRVRRWHTILRQQHTCWRRVCPRPSDQLYLWSRQVVCIAQTSTECREDGDDLVWVALQFD